MDKLSVLDYRPQTEIQLFCIDPMFLRSGALSLACSPPWESRENLMLERLSYPWPLVGELRAGGGET